MKIIHVLVANYNNCQETTGTLVLSYSVSWPM